MHGKHQVNEWELMISEMETVTDVYLVQIFFNLSP